MKVYFVFEPADDPYGGDDYFHGCFSSLEKAQKVCDEYNSTLSETLKKYGSWYVLEGDLDEIFN